MHEPSKVFPVHQEAVAAYLRISMTLLLLLTGIWMFGLGILAALIYWLLSGNLVRRQAGALYYRIEGGKLCVDSGVYFLKRKTIPLERVTDFMLAQGPLQRRYGIWALHVQTAGGPQTIAEAVLLGIENPEQVRDELLRARDAAAERARVI